MSAWGLTNDTIIPANEAERITALRRYDILDTPPDGAFDRITAVAARCFDVPVAIVSVVDTDRIWFKSHHGLPDVTEIGRDPGLCASAILQYEPWVVNDAAVDPRTLTNPLVAGELGLRFYAGVPLTTHDGFNLGTLCVLDTEPREVTGDEIAILEDLATVVMNDLEMRRAAIATVAAESTLRRRAEELVDGLQASLMPPARVGVGGLDVATRYIPAVRDLDVGGDVLDVFGIAPGISGVLLGDMCGKGGRAASLGALARWSVRAAAMHEASPARVLADVNAILRSVDDADDHFCSGVFARVEVLGDRASVVLASGGHPLPWLVRRTGSVEQRGTGGDLLGLFDDVSTTDDRVDLGRGDALVFYTDGIVEAREADGTVFGQAGLCVTLESCVGLRADEIVTRVVDAVTSLERRHPDDIAVVVLRVPE